MAFTGIFCWGRGKYVRCRGRCLYPHISTATHSAHSWGDMTQSRCTTVCPFPPLCNVYAHQNPFFLLPSPSFVSRTRILYWHMSTPAFSAPNTIKFCNYREKKKRKLNLSSTTCSLQTHSPSCIFGALQTLSGKNCSGLGHIASSVTGRPYKEKDNGKRVKTCR